METVSSTKNLMNDATLQGRYQPRLHQQSVTLFFDGSLLHLEAKNQKTGEQSGHRFAGAPIGRWTGADEFPNWKVVWNKICLYKYNPYDIYEGRSVDRDGYSRYSRKKVAEVASINQQLLSFRLECFWEHINTPSRQLCMKTNGHLLSRPDNAWSSISKWPKVAMNLKDTEE